MQLWLSVSYSLQACRLLHCKVDNLMRPSEQLNILSSFKVLRVYLGKQNDKASWEL